MKKLLLALCMVMCSLPMWALRDSIPEVPTTADFEAYRTGNTLIGFYTEADVCNPIVLAGSYNNWNVSSLDSMVYFQPMEGFSNWYVCSYNDYSDYRGCKIVQLADDGVFNWDYQISDDLLLLSGEAVLSAGYFGEVNIQYLGTDEPVVFASGGWKNGKNPCNIMYHHYMIELTAPDCSNEQGETFEPFVIGGFNNWSQFMSMEDLGNHRYRYFLYAAEDTEIAFVGSDDDLWLWQNRFQMQDPTSGRWVDVPNIVLGSSDTIDLDYSEGRFSLCSSYTIPEVPTTADFEAYRMGNVLIGFYTEAEVCNPIVLAGSYNNWKVSSLDSMVYFQPMEGFSNWYVCSYNDYSDYRECKIVQLANDGVFNWDYQISDDLTLLSGEAMLSAGYAGEVNIQYLGTDEPVVFASGGWKNGKNPCDVTYHHYMIELTAPDCSNLLGQTFEPLIIGGFNNWTTALPMEDLGNHQYRYFLYAAEGTEISFMGSGAEMWENTIQWYNYNSERWRDMSNIILGSSDTIYLDYSDGRFRLCGAEPPANQVIYYMTIDDNIFIPHDTAAFNTPIISNTYMGYGRLVFAEPLTTIDDLAFCNCDNLRWMSVPEDVQTIGRSPWLFCDNLQAIDWYAIDCSLTEYAMCDTMGAFYACPALSSVYFGDQVQRIPSRLCAGLTGLDQLNFPASVTEIGAEAFRGCSSVMVIDAAGSTPAQCGANCFEGIDRAITIFVPAGAADAYREAAEWKRFLQLMADDAEEVEDVTSVTLEVTNTTATLTWTAVDDAATYRLTISKDGEVVCVLTFNSYGQLLNIAFAPSRRVVAEQQNGFSFTVSCLDSNTAYTYSVESFDAENELLEEQTGSFVTQPEITTQLRDAQQIATATKLLHDGHLFIQRGNRTYDAHGALLK